MKSKDFKDFKDFKLTVIKSLNVSDNFKIVCKNEEEESLALTLGSKAQSEDENSTVVEGRVTQVLKELFKDLEKPDNNKLMPFYALILDDKIYFKNYAQEHYIK